MKTFSRHEIEKIKKATMKLLKLTDIKDVSYITKEYFEQEFEDVTARAGNIVLGHDLAAPANMFYYFKSDQNMVLGCDELPKRLDKNSFTYSDSGTNCVETGQAIVKFTRR
ncbi:MAG TPA: hypothetical protein VFF57_01340 [Hanamia sp.]|nr:hypothetical protein [Hanamia sp.]